MKKLKYYPVTNYNKFPQKYYFLSIIKEIIKIANLINTQKKILDFGCGNKIFSNILLNKKIINYDINPFYSEIKDYRNKRFDIVIFNHVLRYLKPMEIKKTLEKIKKLNPKSEIVVSLSRQNIFSKLAMIITLNFKAHEKTHSTYKEQIEQINNIAKIKDKKLGIFGITDIFFLKFK